MGMGGLMQCIITIFLFYKLIGLKLGVALGYLFYFFVLMPKLESNVDGMPERALSDRDEEPEGQESSNRGNISPRSWRKMSKYKCKSHRKLSYLFVGRLPYSVDDTRLEAIFSRFGRVISARVHRNIYGSSRGYGFVRFSHPDEAESALGEPIEYEGRTLNVERDKQRRKSPDGFARSSNTQPNPQRYNCEQFYNFNPYQYSNLSYPYQSYHSNLSYQLHPSPTQWQNQNYGVMQTGMQPMPPLMPPKADPLFVPRENPRPLVIRPPEQWHSRSSAEKTKASSTPVHENGFTAAHSPAFERTSSLGWLYGTRYSANPAGVLQSSSSFPSPCDMRSAIQIEIEKERIRQEIMISEIVARKCCLEAELMGDRELAGQRDVDGYPDGSSPQEVLQSPMSLEWTNGSCEGGGFDISPFQRGDADLSIMEVKAVSEVDKDNQKTFGQSSSSPFGSQPVFGQTNKASSNPFAPKPFGSTSPFGAQTGGTMFGGMSTGVFGAQSSSPLGSSCVFGASSPAFGASSGSAFGNSSSAFGSGSLVFGQNPTFGGFGSSTTQTSPFGSSLQQSQSQLAIGSNLFGSSTPFGAPSQPAFGASSSPAFGAPSTRAFGAVSTPAFGSTASPAFGSTSGGFGAPSSPFGTTAPAFGASSTPAFGASSIPAFGAASTLAFGGASTPAFGASPTTAFGASSAPSFNFGSSPAFGQSTSAFGSNPFGATSSFGAQSASFGKLWPY